MLKAQYIPGVNNRAADALSMNDKDSFFLPVVGARRDPTPISAEVTEALLFHPQDWTSAKVSKPLCKGWHASTLITSGQRFCLEV